jgi:hypothetical protein
MKRGFVDVMRETLAKLAPGLKNVGPQVMTELNRLGKQGSLEMAQALFNGGAFTPYGPGQYTPTPKTGKGNQEQEVQTAEPHHGPEREIGGREM